MWNVNLLIMKRIPILLFVFIVIFSCKMISQERWDMEKCIEHAHEHNIQIKQQKLSTEIDENALKQTKLDALPSLNLGASHNFSYGRALDETTYEFTQNREVQTSNFSVNSSVVLFNGFKKWNAIEKNKFSLKASLQDLEKLKNDISLNVVSAYLQILFNQELLEIAENQLEITGQQISRTEKLVDAGSLPKGSLLEIQSQRAREELNLVDAKNQLENSYLTLTQLLELESTEDFDIVRPELGSIDNPEPLVSVKEVYEEATSILPRVKGAEYNLKSEEEAHEEAKGDLLPRLSLNFAYGSRYSSIRDRIAGVDTTIVPFGFTEHDDIVYTSQPSPVYEDYPFFNQLEDNANTSVMLNLSIPIFNGWQTRNRISNAKVSVLNAQYQLEDTKNRLYKEIQDAYSDALAAWKRYIASERTVESMEESFKYTKQKFEVGMVNSVEYNTAKNDLTKAESDLLQAKYEYIFKSRILDFYQGKPLVIE